MTSILRLFIAGMCLFLFCQCSMNKDSYLKDFETFISKTEKDYSEMSDQDWEKTLAQFKDYSEKYYEQFKEELDVNEKISISMLKSKFSSCALKRESKKLQEQLEIK